MGKFSENWVSWKHSFTVSIFRKNIGAPHPTVLGMSPSSSLLGCSRHISWFCRWSDVQDWYELDPRWHLERRYARANTLLPFTIRQWTIKRRLFRRLRPVGAGSAGDARAPPDFGIWDNLISNRGGSLCPPHYYWHPRIFRPSYSPVQKTIRLKSDHRLTRQWPPPQLLLRLLLLPTQAAKTPFKKNFTKAHIVNVETTLILNSCENMPTRCYRTHSSRFKHSFDQATA